MDEPTQDQPLSEDQPAQETSPVIDEGLQTESGPASEDEPPAKLPEGKSQRILKFVVGFFGWFLVTFLVFGGKMESNGMEISLGVVFFANIVILTFLLKKRSFIGWGMLSAIAVNLIASIILGLFMNAVCFIPFYKH